MTRLDLTSLALFLKVVDSGSLSRAAQQSHIALSAASRRIGLLEEEFGVALLHRKPTGVEATGAGLALASHVRQLLRGIDQMRAELTDYAQGARGHVRLRANVSAMGQSLPDELASFSQQYPDIKLEIREYVSRDILQTLREGSADVGIVTGTAQLAGLRAYPYCADRLVAILPRQHPWRKKKAQFADLLDYDIIGLESNTNIHRAMEAAAATAGKPLRLRIQVRSFEVVCRMIEAGFGIGILPEGVVQRFRREMALRFVALTDPWAQRSMFVCVREEAMPLPTRKLVEHLLKRPLSTSEAQGGSPN